MSKNKDLIQFAVKEEATPGTAETLAASDVPVRLRQGSIAEPSIESIDLEEVQDNSSSRPNIAGIARLGANISYVLRTPNDVALGTEPAVKALLQACMFKQYVAKTIGIGAIAGGPYQAGDTITGGTSGGTGMVLEHTADGASDIAYLELSGTLQDAETLTGSGGATCTSSGSPAAAGYGFKPEDSDLSTAGHLATIGFKRDGQFWQGRGALSDLEVQFRANNPAIVSQRFVSAYISTTDAANWDVTYPETAVPPLLKAMALSLDAYSPVGIVDFTLNWPTGVELSEDAQNANGVTHADYDRKGNTPTISFDKDQVAVSTFDVFGKLVAGTTMRMEWVLGTTGGNRLKFAVREAQLTEAGLGEGTPAKAKIPMTFRLNGDNKNEVLIWFR